MGGTQQRDRKSARAGKYSNFSDPVGLLMRMLRSGNRAAYGALFRAAFTVGLTPLDWMLQINERRRLTKVDNFAPKHPLLLIVGPPRSGSTLLFQATARYANASYLTNLTSMFPRSPISCASLVHSFNRRSKASTSKSLSNYYGQTPGLAAPNDGFEVWNRWLGADRYQAPDSLEPELIDEMQRFFAAWTAEFDCPFLNKNNRNALCLGLLSEILPRAVFVVIRREPVLVAQSLIEARQNVQGAKTQPWGLASRRRHADANDPYGYVDDVCEQLLQIEHRLQSQLASVAKDRFLETTYEDFCADPHSNLRRISDHVDGLQLDEELMSAELSPFSVSSSLRLSKDEIERIEHRFAGSADMRPHFLDKRRSVPS